MMIEFNSRSILEDIKIILIIILAIFHYHLK
jgi:hypothetical protein